VAPSRGQDERSLSGSVARRSSSAGTLHRRTTGHRAIGTALKACIRKRGGQFFQDGCTADIRFSTIHSSRTAAAAFLPTRKPPAFGTPIRELGKRGHKGPS
jgi:hypothetical protein